MKGKIRFHSPTAWDYTNYKAADLAMEELTLLRERLFLRRHTPGWIASERLSIREIRSDSSTGDHTYVGVIEMATSTNHLVAQKIISNNKDLQAMDNYSRMEAVTIWRKDASGPSLVPAEPSSQPQPASPSVGTSQVRPLKSSQPAGAYMNSKPVASANSSTGSSSLCVARNGEVLEVYWYSWTVCLVIF